eukprot:jgi/Phyca11/575387/estExt2_Genewise1.C_PHYCAscaffold_730046
MIETLTHAFGDEKLAKVLAAVKKNEGKAKKIASELESAQLKMWLSSGKSVDDVYELLNLPTKGLHYDFGGNLVFMTWIAYLNTYSVAHPEKVNRLLSTMTTEFRDRAMMQILQAAGKFPSMERVAATLQLQKAEKVFATGVSPYKTFTMLSLDTVGDSVLGSPVFAKWMAYVDDFNKKHPEKEDTWFTTLHAMYGNLDKLIETARKNLKTHKIADMVEKMNMEDWLKRMKFEPKSVFRSLNLHKSGVNSFSDSNFALWVKYLNDFNLKYPEKKTTMIDSIRANYIDLNLIQILDELKKVPSTAILAKNLENALLEKWVDEKVTIAYLKGLIGHMPSSNVWIERYTKMSNKLP